METGWKEVFTTSQEYEAIMAKDLLENEGIKVIILDQKDTAYQAFGDYRIFVFEGNEQRAIEILKNLKN